MAVPAKGAVLSVLKGGAATVILFIVYLAVPILGMFSGAVSPFPALFYGLRDGMGRAFAVVGLSALILTLLEPTGGLFYLSQGGIISLSLAFFLRRGEGGARAITGTTAINVAVIAAGAAAFSAIRGVNIHSLVVNGVQTMIVRTTELYQKSGITGDELAAARSALVQSAAVIVRTYPALIVIGVVTITGVNLLLATRNRTVSGNLQVGPFRGYRNSDHLVWIFIAGGFASFFGPPLLRILGLNLLLVSLFLYLLQGLAVIAWYFERYAVSRVMRVIFYVFFALQPFLALVVTLVGLFDLWGNFRAPKRKNL